MNKRIEFEMLKWLRGLWSYDDTQHYIGYAGKEPSTIEDFSTRINIHQFSRKFTELYLEEILSRIEKIEERLQEKKK